MARRRRPPAQTRTEAPRSWRSRGRGAIAVAALTLAAVIVGWRLQRGETGRPNLLLVTFDTLRADRVGSYGYAGAATPTLDGLARRGARFEQAQSTAPLTGPSHATIMTGLYPPEHGVRDNVTFPLGERHPTLAALLGERGYRTAAFVSAYPVAAELGFGRGFGHYSQTRAGQFFGQGAQRPADQVADDALAWLAHRDGQPPFFVWLHFYDPHAPYTPPPAYRDRFAENPYDGEVAFADAQFGRVLTALSAAGMLESTVVVATSDHGEGLGDHGEATHGVLVYESTLRVPLIVAGPGIPAGHRVAERVGTVDLLPTMLGLVGVPAPAALHGRDLRPALAGRRLPTQPLYSESLFGRLNCRWAPLRAWTGDGWKLVQGERTELFELARDPAEHADLFAAERERAESLAGGLRAAVRRMAPGGDAARPAALTREQEERLRSLGYAGGTGAAGPLDQPGLPDPRERVGSYDRLQKALLARAGALAPALREASAIAATDPGNPFAHYVVASVAYRAGELELAERAFARTLALDPDRLGTRHQYGRLLRDRGRLAEAERELRIAAEQGGNDPAPRISLAETLVDEGQLQEADRLLSQVLAANPDHAGALRARGRQLSASGRTEEALAALQKAARDGSDPEAWIDLASALLERGRAHEAREAVGRALEGNPAHPWALAVMGHALALEGRKPEALGVLRRARAIGPRRPEVWLALARGFAVAGDRAAAAACRQRAVARAGGDRHTGPSAVEEVP